jgi:beta-fructofuranosidase
MNMANNIQHKDILDKANKSISKVKDIVKNDRYRQRYHFMAPAYWINDPNGLVQYNGRYHLFYQHNPYAPVWGAMHWGHAVSTDLVHWEHLPIALAPSEEYDNHERGGCFSGSAVDDNGILSILYTATTNYGDGFVQTQCLATSSDGINFEKYEGNPVVKEPPQEGSADFRDPKVWKHGDSWYMVVGSSRDGRGKALLYKSPDLRQWEYVNVLAESRGEWGTMWECPDFFAIGDKYVLMFSPMNIGDRKTVYLVGDMDYRTGRFLWSSTGEVDWGYEYYAPQSLMDNKGRRIIIGWANAWDWMPWWKGFGPTSSGNWCGAMGLPRTVKLCPDGKLRFEPVEELVELRRNCYSMSDIIVEQGRRIPISAGDGISYEIVVDFDMGECTASSFWLALRCSETEETLVGCDISSGELVLDRSHSDNWSQGIRKCLLESASKDSVQLHIFVDTCSVEVFADGGRTVMSSNIYPSEESRGLYVYTSNGSVKINSLKAWGLSSIWDKDGL